MKKYSIILTLFATLTMIMAFTVESTVSDDEDLTECLKKAHTAQWDTKCIDCKNDVGTYKVCLKNECNQKIDVLVCCQEKNKTWRQSLFYSVAANDTVVAFACNGTGKYRKWVRKAGDKSVTFPTIDDVNAQYKD